MSSRHRRRRHCRGFILGGVLLFIVFYLGFCYQTWKHGRAASRQLREAKRQAAEIKKAQPPLVLQRSPDGQYGFHKQRRHALSLNQQWTLVSPEGAKHVIHDGSGRVSIKWRPDSKAFVLQENIGSKYRVTLFFLDGRTVTREALTTHIISSAEVRTLCGDPEDQRFSHLVQALGYREDGKLQVSWQARSKNRESATKRFVRQFLVSCEQPTEIYITQTFR